MSLKQQRTRHKRAFYYCLQCGDEATWEQPLISTEWLGILCSKCHKKKVDSVVVFDRDKKFGKLPKNLRK